MPSDNTNPRVPESRSDVRSLSNPSSSANQATSNTASKNAATATTPNPPAKRLAFVHKLYYMLSDKELSHLIWWSGSNDSEGRFAINPCPEFSKILTQFFKHSNISSFVRQLHMYGFHKVNNGSLSTNSDAKKEGSDIWEFRHTSGMFKKGDEVSLSFIKRRQPLNSMKSSTAFHTLGSHSEIPMHHSHSLPDYRMAGTVNPYGSHPANNQRYSVPYLYPYERNPYQMFAPSPQQQQQQQQEYHQRPMQHVQHHFSYSSPISSRGDSNPQYQSQPYMYQGQHLPPPSEQQRTYVSGPVPPSTQQPTMLSNSQTYVTPSSLTSTSPYYSKNPQVQIQPASAIHAAPPPITSSRFQQDAETSTMEPHKYPPVNYPAIGGAPTSIANNGSSNFQPTHQADTKSYYGSIVSPTTKPPIRQSPYISPITNHNNINGATPPPPSFSNNASSSPHVQSQLPSINRSYDSRSLIVKPIASAGGAGNTPTNSSNNNNAQSPFSTPRYTEESKIRAGSFVDPLSNDSKYGRMPLPHASQIAAEPPSNAEMPVSHGLVSVQEGYEGRPIRSSEPNIDIRPPSQLRNSIFAAHGNPNLSMPSSSVTANAVTATPMTTSRVVHEGTDKTGGANNNIGNNSVLRSMRSSVLSVQSSISSNSTSQRNSFNTTPFSSIGSTASTRSYGGSVSSISHLLNNGVRSTSHLEGDDYKKRIHPINSGGSNSTIVSTVANHGIKQKQQAALQNGESDKSSISVSSLLGSSTRKRSSSYAFDNLPESKKKC